MLDAFIIEQLRERDEESRRILERPALQMPMPLVEELEPEREEEETEPSRVIVISDTRSCTATRGAAGPKAWTSGAPSAGPASVSRKALMME